MFSPALISKAKLLLKNAEKKNILIATAESCTGGLVAALLTEIPGSSSVFERGFVTYSNAAKASLLGVPKTLITKHGAVSNEAAASMATGAIKHSKAMLSVAVTGVAGPGGGTKEKPVGLVYIAVARKGKKPQVKRHLFKGNRSKIRLATVEQALLMLERAL